MDQQLDSVRTSLWLSRFINSGYYRSILFLLLMGYWGVGFTAAQQSNDVTESTAAFTAEQLEYFEQHIRPLFAEHCYECHSAKSVKLQAGLRVDSRNSLLAGGDSGAALDLKEPSNSLLLQSVRYESYEMPPKGKLAEDQIAKLEKWVTMGAPWPNESEPSASAEAKKFDLKARLAEHWVWKPVSNPDRPSVRGQDWPSTDADYFILAALEKAELQPAPPADRLAILRRLYFDLIGIPPTEAEINSFLKDQSEGAMERVVDQLLQSPHFGERWGRHWLDLVRYAESRGHEFDNDTPNAYQYRDYVIRALNADVPYDQLVREHIAGDLLPEPRLNPKDQFNESVLGTGFWFLGEWVHSPVDIRKDEADRFDNMLDVMSKTFLGVTVACARCHDHKFDAISSNDYYALSGFLQSSDYRQVAFEALPNNSKIAKELADLDSRYQKQVLALIQDKKPSFAKLGIPSSLQPNVVVDYAVATPETYMQDGVSFGLEPTAVGSLSFNRDAALSVNSFSAAKNDSFWDGLQGITEGIIQNSSRLDHLPRSGRTLRTPTFEVTKGDVRCLVQGRGYITAVVDSHRLIAGPLHGETIREFGENERWVRLNLSRYLGHRVHLEITPAENASVAVRMVLEGVNDEEFNKFESELLKLDQVNQAMATEYNLLFNETKKRTQRVLADFEGGSYGEWKLEGTAFGEVPQQRETIADYQGDVNHRGKFFINSHNIRKSGANTAAGDAPTGKITSPEFVVDCDEIEFLVGGGAHQGKTCVNLLIDGNVVLSTTGRNNNRMETAVWDVRPFAGKKAQIQIVDDHQGGWGNIGADDFQLVDIEEFPVADQSLRQLLSQWKEARQKLSEKVIRKSHLAPAMIDGSGENDHLLIRGNSSKPGKMEPRRFLEAIAGNQPMPVAVGSGRLELAEAINDPENPLTHRVIVNRLWHYLLGRGIVPTVDDFGVLGQRPTNIDLLDHLASKFLSEGRSLKKMIRYIVLSKTYQMSSRSNPEAVAKDPSNLLWHHRPPKRLEGEVIRDSLLAIAGSLDSTQFGPAVPIHLTPFMDGRGRPGTSGPLNGNGRRTIYISVRRNFISPFMLAFDTPVPFSTMGRRNVSNVPAQALILMNDPFVIEQTRIWGSKLAAMAEDKNERIKSMYLMAFARLPTDEEVKIALSLVDDGSDSNRWVDLAHVLVNTKEFIFLR